MISTFTGIEIGKRSLMTHNQALTTTGHNLSNANTEGYSRQRVEMESFYPLYVPGLNREETAGQIGQGVQSQSIRRIKDMMLEERIINETNYQGYWESRDKYLLMMEQVYNEPSDLSVRHQMNQFWEAWQDLSLRPSEIAPRKSVLQRGETLIDSIHTRYTQLKDIRDMVEDDVQGTVKQFNTLIRDIASLNEEIVKVKAMGDHPNDLMDRRDLLLNRLSSMADVTFRDKDPDEFSVYIGGMHVVQGKLFKELDVQFNGNNEGYSDIYWKDTGQQVNIRGGKLAALLELRDGDAREEIQKLDMMTINFVDMVNEIHRDAYGINGKTGENFFNEYPFITNLNGNYDENGDGNFDASYIFRFTGTHSLNPKDHIGLTGTITLPGREGNITVDYFPTDTVEDLIEKINLSGGEIVARLNQQGQLSLKATPSYNIENPDFVIRHLEDSGQFLVGYSGILGASGAAGAYDWRNVDAVNSLNTVNDDGAAFAVAPLRHPSGWIEVNKLLSVEPASVATSLEDPYNGPGDGSAALAIARLQTEPVMIGQASSFDDFFASVVAEIGVKGEQAEIALLTENQILKDLKDMRDSISGVNMDEELANMIKFQHGYSAAARFVSEVDKMLDVIINQMKS